MSLCCSNHSSFPALVNVVHALMHILHKYMVYCDIIQPRLRSDVDRGEHSVTLNDYGPCHMKVASYALCWVYP